MISSSGHGVWRNAQENVNNGELQQKRRAEQTMSFLLQFLAGAPIIRMMNKVPPREAEQLPTAYGLTRV